MNYGEGVEKFNGFQSESIEWSSLCENAKDNWIYRGHSRADWLLETTLERACRRYFQCLDNADELEYTLLREFRRRYHHYATYVPPRDDTLQWLSIMQHHGSPTRLLDWTYSINVAAYFAVEATLLEDLRRECVIWGLNRLWVYDEQTELLYNKRGKDNSAINRDTDDFDEAAFTNSFIKKPWIPCVCQVSPFILNERLTIQRGTFLCPGDVTKSFEENLKAMPGYDSSKNVKRFVLSDTEREKAIKELNEMNINRATLFPGLDGFAQSLKVYHVLASDPKRLNKR